MNRIIELVDIVKDYGGQTVLNHVDLYINQNEFLTLLGPSGCGKTTTLRIIGGFEQPTGGDLLFEGKSILKTPPHKRKLNTIFQKYALFPHMDVAENIAFGLKVNKVAKALIGDKVDAVLKLVNLSGFNKRPIASLSGGQQQRVAIARALVNEPKVLLLDEPLGALDYKLRKDMQFELKQMQRDVGITFVYVTHDQEEALTMSDTVAVLNAGRIMQIGTPEDIYNEPKNAFVASFIGESNILPGTMVCDFCVELLGRQFKCVDKGFSKNEAVDVVVRPEDIVITKPDDSGFFGTVSQVIFKGVHYEMHVNAGGFDWKVHSTNQASCGQNIGLSIAPSLIHVMRKT